MANALFSCAFGRIKYTRAHMYEHYQIPPLISILVFANGYNAAEFVVV